MSPDTLERFLRGDNGILFFDPADTDLPAGLPAESGYLVIHASLPPQASKAGILEELSRAFDMPRWFGHNWDALEDCLTDLEWLPDQPIVLVMTGSIAVAEETHVLIDILRETCAHWQDLGRGFHALVDAQLDPERR